MNLSNLAVLLLHFGSKSFPGAPMIFHSMRISVGSIALASWSIDLELFKQVKHSLITVELHSILIFSVHHFGTAVFDDTMFVPQVLGGLRDFVPQIIWCVVMLHDLIYILVSDMIRIISD